MKRKMQILSTAALFILLCLGSINSFAQDTDRWFRRELGATHTSVYDNGHSLARYQGTGVQFLSGLDTDTRKNFRQLNVGLAYTPLKADVSDRKEVSAGTQGTFTINYRFLHKLPRTQDEKFNVALGGASFLDANLRYYKKLINNPFGWDFNVGLNLIAQVSHDFNFRNHPYTLSYQLGVPVVTYNLSPNYLGSYPVSSAFNRGEVADWLSLGRTNIFMNEKYIYLHQQLSLERNLSNGNKLRITYRWDYSNNGYATHHYQNLTTGISVGLLTSFSNNQ